MRLFILFIISIFSLGLHAQMEIDGEILFGNEWIDYDKTYAKIVVNKDGVYRVTRQELANNGIPVESISFKNLHMWNYGKEVGFFIGDNDSYIEFVGEKNKTQLDKHLLDDPETILNRNYSLVTDNAAYFVTYTEEENDLLFTRVESDLSNNTLPAEPYYMHEEHLVISSTHYKPTDAEEIRFSNVVSGEGYGSGLKDFHNLNIPVSRKAEVSEDAQLYVRYGGNYSFNHNTEISINNESLGVFYSRRDTVQSLFFDIDSDLIEDEMTIKIAGTIEGTTGIVDKKNVSEIVFTYARDFYRKEGDYIISLEPSSIERYIEIDGYFSNDLPIIYDLENNQKIIPQFISNEKIAFLVAPSVNKNRIQISDPITTFYSAKNISERSFKSFADRTDAEYLMISSEGLRNQGATDWVKEYENYRSSEIGGGHKTSLVNVEDLYDQFAYGVDRHFISLKNYIHWTEKTYEDPKFLFIIGKGIEYPNVRIDSIAEKTTNYHVPTWGLPGSDNLLLRTKESSVPIFPVGRLAASNSDDVKNYLDKVKGHEGNSANPSTIIDRGWQKSMIHLSGGSQSLGNSLFVFLEEMRDTIENNFFGAKVNTYRKESTEAIEFATDDLIFDDINKGVSIITFFGHASPNAFDFNLDNVENYNNKDKYFLLASLGCYSGNIHTQHGGISESFVLAKEKGAVAFLAASGTAFVDVQKRFGTEFYSAIGGEFYGKSIGEAMVAVIDEFSGITSTSYVTFYQQLTFHGDPSIKLPNFESPDYIPDATSVGTNPKFVDTYEDDFELCFDIVNLGLAIKDSISVKIEHLNPNDEIVTDTLIRILAPMNSESYCISMPISSTDLVGKNLLNIEVDALNDVTEFPSPVAELNNVLVSQNGEEGFEIFILNNSAVPTYPREYDIVNDNSVSLISSTYNALGEPQTFVMQIDTTTDFNSSKFVQKTFEDVRGTIQWDLDFQLSENTVYYWRVSPDSISTDLSYVWSESSFVYETNAENGWNQSHFYQYQKNEYENIKLNPNRKLSFVTNLKQVLIDNKIWSPGLPAQYIIDNGFQSSMMDRNASPSIGVAVIDSIGNYLQNPPGGEFGSINLKSVPINTFYFKTNDQQGRLDLVNFLESIPDRQFVTLYSVFSNSNTDLQVEQWAQDSLINDGKNIFNVLEREGAIYIRGMETEERGLPYAIIYKKGISTLSEAIADDRESSIEVQENLPGFWFEGNIISDYVGPAERWSNVVWELKQPSIMDNDTTFISIYGYDISKENSTLLYDSIQINNFDISNIDASIYPYLKLEYYAKDVDDVSPVQLDSWRVYYEELGDITLNTAKGYSFYADSLQQGDRVTLNFNVNNFSNSDMKETKILYSIIDSENNVIEIEENLSQIASRSSEEISFSYDTRNLLGYHQLQVELNPKENPLEEYYFNNFGLDEFVVYPDTTNPLLQVTFDGVVILDQDIVSSKPLINIELTDENEFIFLENPNNFILILTSPDGQEKQIDLSSEDVNFYTDNSEGKNKSWIEYSPELQEDGMYKLFVEAVDESENRSGEKAYEVRFRVFNEEMVSNVFNYPNPFSTSTQFVFTLTGNEEPGNILIRIMTVTGKVVREITAAELGQLRIGVNKTEYKWDGTDDYGQRLGNGVYLYQVITKKFDGTDYKKFTDETENNTDYLFKEGFGKLVIMR